MCGFRTLGPWFLLFDDGDDAVVSHLLRCGHGFSLGVGPPVECRLWGEGRNCWIRYLY